MKFFDTKKKESESPVSSTPAPAKPTSPQESPVRKPEVMPSVPGPSAAPAPVAPAAPPPPTVSVPAPPVGVPSVSKPAMTSSTSATVPEAKPAPAGKTVIGGTATIHGDIISQEDLVVNGVVEGSIKTTRDVLIGSEGKIRADIQAASIIIQGDVQGNVDASRKISLEPSSRLQGNIHCPRVTVSDEAMFNGRIDMSGNPIASKSAKED